MQGSLVYHITYFAGQGGHPEANSCGPRPAEARQKYLERLVQEAGTYPWRTDVFVHSNAPNPALHGRPLPNGGTVTVVQHALAPGENPYYLAWKNRELLFSQVGQYDAYAYTADDILVPRAALEYWRDHKDAVMADGYNLGFLRIETLPGSGTQVVTDLYGEHLDRSVVLGGKLYALNDKNPFCDFWIYDKTEFERWVRSEHWDLSTIRYGIPESAGVGLHGLYTRWYKGTVIPVLADGKSLHPDCRVYHLPNNFAPDSSPFATIPFASCFTPS